MATTENLHAGDGSKTKFSFTFPYLNQTDVEVYVYATNAWVKKTVTTHYTFTNATTITFGSAPAAATTAEQTNLGNTNNIKIKRNTSGDSLAATFYPGSAIRAGDLNDNYTQNLYVTQEASNAVTDANTESAAAVATADTAKATADDAADDVKRWIKDGDGTDTAGDEDDADFSARPLKPQGVPYAVTRSNTAISDSTTALGKANTAIADSAAAVITANAASAAVDTVMPYTIVANKAALPANADQDDIFEVTDSTDLEDLGGGSDIIWVNAAGSTSGQDIAALKPNVTWDSGITLKMKKYGTSTSDRKYIFQSYYANDPESKYVRAAAATFTESVILDNAKELRLSETDANGSHYLGVKAPDSVTANKTFTLPDGHGSSGQVLTCSDASGTLGWTTPTVYQASDTELTAIAGLTSAADKGIQFTGSGTAGTYDLTAFAKTILDDADAAAARTTLGAQASDADLTAIAGLTSAADKGIQFTGSGTAGVYDLTAFAKTILDDADAGAVRTTIGAGTGNGDAIKTANNAWTGVNSNAPEVVSSATSITIDLSSSNNFILTTGHGTIQFENPSTEIAGASGSIFIVQGGTTCAAPSWGNQWLFSGGTAPSFTATTGKIGRVDYIVQDTSKIHCVATDDLVLTS